MILSTTPTIEGRGIVTYHGVVGAETIFSANFVKDFAAGVRDFLGGRSRGYEKTLQNARQTALDELSARAEALGANAIVGIDLDYEVIGSNNSMMMVCASGTAVTLS